MFNGLELAKLASKLQSGGFVSSTSPAPSPAPTPPPSPPKSPERKKTKITAPQESTFLLQALGYTWLENYSCAVDNLIRLSEQDYEQLSSDERQLIIRMFEKLSFYLKLKNNYEVLQRLQQVVPYFQKDENIPNYVLEIAKRNNNHLQEHKDKIQDTAPAVNENELLAQAVGHFELGENNYAKGIEKLKKFYLAPREHLLSYEVQQLVNIYNDFSRSIFTVKNIPVWKELQELFHGAMKASLTIRDEIKEKYIKNNLILRYNELKILFSQKEYKDAIVCFFEIYFFIPQNELLSYYMVLSDHVGPQLDKIQDIATQYITSQDSIYLTKYYYKNAIVASNNPEKCIGALKACIEHAKESSYTARKIHLCLAQLQTLMSETEFATYEQKMKDESYFDQIDTDKRTFHEWTYFDHRKFSPKEWLLLRNVVNQQSSNFKLGKIPEEIFVKNMNYVINIIQDTKDYPEKSKFLYKSVIAKEFYDEHPNFFEKFKCSIMEDMPQSARNATNKMVVNDPESPTLSGKTSSAATSEANAVLGPQIKLSL